MSSSRLMTRRDLRLIAQIPVMVSGQGRSILGTTRNVGLGGMFVSTAKKYDQGAMLVVELDVSHGPRPLRARVVRQAADGIGCEFVDNEASVEDDLMVLLDHLIISGSAADERRRLARSESQRAIAWREQRVINPAQCMNFSSGGARLASVVCPKPGTTIYVMLDSSPDGRGREFSPGTLDCSARVAYRAGSEFGMQFLEPSGAFITALHSAGR